jgi:hypothetical protein
MISKGGDEASKKIIIKQLTPKINLILQNYDFDFHVT